MTTTTTAAPPRALWWSERGEIGCDEHKPYEGSDTWMWGRWQRLTASDQAAMQRELGRPVGCECCDAMRQRREGAR